METKTAATSKLKKYISIFFSAIFLFPSLVFGICDSERDARDRSKRHVDELGNAINTAAVAGTIIGGIFGGVAASIGGLAGSPLIPALKNNEKILKEREKTLEACIKNYIEELEKIERKALREKVIFEISKIEGAIEIVVENIKVAGDNQKIAADNSYSFFVGQLIEFYTKRGYNIENYEVISEIEKHNQWAIAQLNSYKAIIDDQIKLRIINPRGIDLAIQAAKRLALQADKKFNDSKPIDINLIANYDVPIAKLLNFEPIAKLLNFEPIDNLKSQYDSYLQKSLPTINFLNWLFDISRYPQPN